MIIRKWYSIVETSSVDLYVHPSIVTKLLQSCLELSAGVHEHSICNGCHCQLNSMSQLINVTNCRLVDYCFYITPKKKNLGVSHQEIKGAMGWVLHDQSNDLEIPHPKTP